ncbi:hypothetical protein LFYK43_14200 [Ligilactobacillus salitolerans]|uniref:Uncharacterized protein n=1 Tax=Ligilactobacillus salitolerans TaxID=1808352 RepID=A0A401ITU4_9LACO|nr:hypothetical protein [Ligilactobacillus salitolerans]GBG94961.1 hypothetical protein LFYK43_14200 [Ligilactobacillus salitolerans]
MEKPITVDEYQDNPEFWEQLALSVGGVEVKDESGKVLFDL